MLRLREVEPVTTSSLVQSPDGDVSHQEEHVLAVRFEGDAGDCVFCTMTITMRPRATDEQLLVDAKKALRDAVALLHAQMQDEAR